MTEPTLKEPTGTPSHVSMAPDGVAVDLALAQGMARSVERRGWAASLLAAATAHVLLIAALIEGMDRGTVGAGGTELESISVELVSSSILESRASETSAAAAGAYAVDHERDGAEQERQASASAADQRPRFADRIDQAAGPVPELVVSEPVVEDPAPDPEQLAVAMAPAKPQDPDDRLPDTEPQRVRDETATESAPASQGSEPQDVAVQGGAASRGGEAAETVAVAAAAASAGAASDYAKEVIQTLARRKPRATAGVRGTVRIGFTVARTGEVSEARVLVSSGKNVLDDAALDAVRGARFPAPPPALATARLSYEIPYIFR